MYRYQRKLYEKEAIYIAGPECFYTNGPDQLRAMRVRSESLGFGVTLPNDNPLDMGNPSKRKRADSIFEDLKADMEKTTVILSDLEAYRGAEPDSGTVYEIGMAYAKGARSYGYTRDKRSLGTKNQGAVLKDGKLYDERGQIMPYANLPFAPSIIGSTKIIEGDYDDCLNMLRTDLEEEYKQMVLSRSIGNNEDHSIGADSTKTKKPAIYLAGFERYEAQAEQLYAHMKQICQSYGYEAIAPIDPLPGAKEADLDNPYIWAAHLFDQYQQHVRDCDILLANLNDYRGYEVSNDVGFECGMAFELGKRLYGYMDSTANMTAKIPHLGEADGYRDQTGSNVEDFDYPANLMFGCSMKILEGKFEEIIGNVIADVEKQL